jgi:hypothetical protein
LLDNPTAPPNVALPPPFGEIVPPTVPFSDKPHNHIQSVDRKRLHRRTHNALAGRIFITTMQNGIPADSVLLLSFISIISINGLRNQRVGLEGITPADPGFHRVRALMRDIQIFGAVRLYIRENANKEQKRIIALHTENIPPEIQADIAELRRLLHLNADAKEFELTSTPLPSSDTELAVETRSISELLQVMEAQVEVPPGDVSEHKAFPGFETEHELPGIAVLFEFEAPGKNRTALW